LMGNVMACGWTITNLLLSAPVLQQLNPIVLANR